MTRTLPGDTVCLARCLPALDPDKPALPVGMIGTVCQPTKCLNGQAVIDFGRSVGIVDPAALLLVTPAFWWRDVCPPDGTVLSIELWPNGQGGSAKYDGKTFDLEGVSHACIA